MGKNIVIFSDGTGNEGGEGKDSNVFKLYNLVEKGTAKQEAFYDPGLGKNFLKLTGSAFGLGISRNIRQCYKFLVDHHQTGDEVFLFGFSRGAYTVRSLGGFIRLCGVLPPGSSRKLIKKAYKVYRTSDKNERKAKGRQFQTDHGANNCKIKLIGVWDTVRALGLPINALDRLNPVKHEFHDSTLDPDVSFGFHALSIDDERRTFHPTLWDEKSNPPKQTIEQVWFAGMHSDVGGGYPRGEHGLSNIALAWMIDRATKNGLIVCSAIPNHYKHTDPHMKMHDSRSGLGKLYLRKSRKESRDLKLLNNPRLLHDSVQTRSNKPANGYNPWILGGPPHKFTN